MLCYTLVFDEEGSLVKTYANPYRYDFGNTLEDRNPLRLNYINPIYSIIRVSTISILIV